MKQHKFFERYLDNDLNVLYKYLYSLQEKFFYDNMLSLPEDIKNKYNDFFGSSTQFGKYYNIFKFNNIEVKKLKKSLVDMAIEACNYYGYDYYSKDYYIWGWFNLDKKIEQNAIPISPITNNKNFHDHSGGFGYPYLHGYYCVNAEPSSTYYLINNKDIFKNINKNNRAILSETGHPHGRDDWNGEMHRITIAYDITPFELIENKDNNLWVKL